MELYLHSSIQFCGVVVSQAQGQLYLYSFFGPFLFFSVLVNLRILYCTFPSLR